MDVSLYNVPRVVGGEVKRLTERQGEPVQTSGPAQAVASSSPEGALRGLLATGEVVTPGLGVRRLPRAAADGARRFVRRRLIPSPPESLVESALPAARARAVCEAVLVVLAGFVLDDLRALRVPGFAAGAILAILILAFGSVLHARRMATRVVHLPLSQAYRRLVRARVLWRIAAGISLFVFFAWLSYSLGGTA